MKYLHEATMLCENHLAKHLGPGIFLDCHLTPQNSNIILNIGFHLLFGIL